MVAARRRVAMAVPLAVGEAVWARFGVGPTLAWYPGTVMERRGDGASPWEQYRVAWSV